MRRPDPSALGAGISILALGALLFLEAEGSLRLKSEGLAAALGACVLLAVVATMLGSHRRRPAAGGAGDEADDAAHQVSRETGRISTAGFALGLILAAAVIALWAAGVLETAGSIALGAVIVGVALALISTPLLVGLVTRLSAERIARARSEERAEVAAHLHDSVLQTLALMQKRAGDPDEIVRLARRQERELRDWLAGNAPDRPHERLADALRTAAIEVEDSHGAPIEAIVVGDAPLDERREALVAATREALTNAVKFASDGGPVRLYAEIEDGDAKVYVDDRGPGFDTDAVPDDRRGVRESIIGRMKRYGGRAKIRSSPGEGTEIELTLKGGER